MISDGITATFDPADTKGMGNATVNIEGASAFCFSGLPFTPHNANATVDVNNDVTHFGVAEVEVEPPGTTTEDCNSGENVEVVTTDASSRSVTPLSFYITFN